MLVVENAAGLGRGLAKKLVAGLRMVPLGIVQVFGAAEQLRVAGKRCRVLLLRRRKCARGCGSVNSGVIRIS